MTHLQFFYALAALQLADAILTAYGLRKGNYEANPLMRAAFKALGVWGGLIVVKGVLLVAAWYFQIDLWTQVFLLIATAVVVVRNVMVTTK